MFAWKTASLTIWPLFDSRSLRGSSCAAGERREVDRRLGRPARDIDASEVDDQRGSDQEEEEDERREHEHLPAVAASKECETLILAHSPAPTTHPTPARAES